MLPGIAPKVAPAPHVAPVVAGAAVSDTGASPATTTSATLPASVAAGDLLVVMAVPSTSGVTISTPAGWTALTWGALTGNGTAAIFYKQAAGGETSVSLTHGSARLACIAYRITGWDSAKAPEVGTAATGSSVNPDPPSISPSWGTTRNDLFLAACCVANGNTGVTSAYPSGYSNGQTTRTQKGDSSDVRISCAEKRTTIMVSSEDPGTFTTTTGAWTAQTIAIAGK